MCMIQRGQIRWLAKADILGPAPFIVALSGVALTHRVMDVLRVLTAELRNTSA
jgi:hypothetical protein